MGPGNSLNSNWGTEQVAKLGLTGNTRISQLMTGMTPEITYVVEFNYAIVTESADGSKRSELLVLWNDDTIKMIVLRSTDTQKMKFSMKVVAKSCNNVLSLIGSGGETGLGITIDNVSVKKYIDEC